MPTEQPSTGDNVAAEMKRRRVSQTTLAKHLGLSQTAVSARLRGRVDWRLTELTATADLLSVQLADLIADEGITSVPTLSTIP